MRNRVGSGNPFDHKRVAGAKRVARETGNTAPLNQVQMMQRTVARHTGRSEKAVRTAQANHAATRLRLLKVFTRTATGTGTNTVQDAEGGNVQSGGSQQREHSHSGRTDSRSPTGGDAEDG